MLPPPAPADTQLDDSEIARAKSLSKPSGRSHDLVDDSDLLCLPSPHESTRISDSAIAAVGPSARAGTTISAEASCALEADGAPCARAIGSDSVRGRRHR